MVWIFFGFLTAIFIEQIIRIGKGYEPEREKTRRKIKH